MTDIRFRIRRWFSDVLSAVLTGRGLRFAGMIALVVVVIAGINAITGSGEETQAAAGYDRRLIDGSSVPYDFQFIGQGRITAGTDGVWVIGGIPIHVDDRTQLMSTLHVGDFVSLSGRISDPDAWLADRIELSSGANSYYTFNGPLEWARGSIWRLGGHSLLVDLATVLGSNLASSEILLATFTVLESGAWQALEIRAFDPTVFEPTRTPSPTSAQKESKDPAATVVPASAEDDDGGDDDDDDDDDNGKDENEDGNKGDKDKGKGEDGDDDDDDKDEHDEKRDDKDKGKGEDGDDDDDDD